MTNRKIKVYERTCQLFQLKSSKKAEEIVGKGVAYLANEIWRVDVWGQNLEVFTLSTAKRVKSCI